MHPHCDLRIPWSRIEAGKRRGTIAQWPRKVKRIPTPGGLGGPAGALAVKRLLRTRAKNVADGGVADGGCGRGGAMV